MILRIFLVHYQIANTMILQSFNLMPYSSKIKRAIKSKQVSKIDICKTLQKRGISRLFKILNDLKPSNFYKIKEN